MQANAIIISFSPAGKRPCCSCETCAHTPAYKRPLRFIKRLLVRFIRAWPRRKEPMRHYTYRVRQLVHHVDYEGLTMSTNQP